MRTHNRVRKNKFYDACKKNDICIVKNILNNNFGNIYHKFGDFSDFGDFLESACKYNRLEIIKQLFEYGEQQKINIKPYLNNICELICSNGYIDILMYIIEYCKNNNFNYYDFIDINYIFGYSCIYGHLNTIRCLIETNITNNDFDIHFQNEYAFRVACCNCNYGVVKYLIKYCRKHKTDININIIHDYAIPYSIRHGIIKLFKYLIEYFNNTGNYIDIERYCNIIFKDIFRLEYYTIIQYIIKYSEKINKRINISTDTIDIELNRYISSNYKVDKQCESITVFNVFI